MQVEIADILPAGRPMRKTLSRKSPFLPEVLPSMIKHEDITYTQENGQTVLLGEGSFGQARILLPHCILHAYPPQKLGGRSRIVHVLVVNHADTQLPLQRVSRWVEAHNRSMVPHISSSAEQQCKVPHLACSSL